LKWSDTLWDEGAPHRKITSDSIRASSRSRVVLTREFAEHMKMTGGAGIAGRNDIVPLWHEQRASFSS
jgi:hypothetical protein